MDKHALLHQYVSEHPEAVGKVVGYKPETDKLLQLDLTAANNALKQVDVSNTAEFSDWISQLLNESGCRYAIGGYMEHRTMYARSALFSSGETVDQQDEPRRLHLGVDIWAEAGTPVYCPVEGKVHSFNDNNQFGDYGPTIIIEHNLDGLQLYSLYGHLNRESLNGLYKGKAIAKNEQIAAFGAEHENGNWPPHLHFQLMFDMEGWEGDYPGVGRFSEKEALGQNIPDPNIILKFPAATIM